MERGVRKVLRFTKEGALPPGDYVMTLQELKRSMLVRGPAAKFRPVLWNTKWRRQLVDNLASLVNQLHQCGITDIFVDGSFVENKAIPADIDGYFVCDRDRLKSGELQAQLNALDPHQIWTWDGARRTPFRDYPKGQLPMWHQYRVELYPDYGQFSGIVDRLGNPLDFPAAFRRSRNTGRPRGIIKLGVEA